MKEAEADWSVVREIDKNVNQACCVIDDVFGRFLCHFLTATSKIWTFLSFSRRYFFLPDVECQTIRNSKKIVFHDLHAKEIRHRKTAHVHPHVTYSSRLSVRLV